MSRVDAVYHGERYCIKNIKYLSGIRVISFHLYIGRRKRTQEVGSCYQTSKYVFPVAYFPHKGTQKSKSHSGNDGVSVHIHVCVSTCMYIIMFNEAR